MFALLLVSETFRTFRTVSLFVGVALFARFVPAKNDKDDFRRTG